MMNLTVLYIFLVLSGYCFCQNTIIISHEDFILPVAHVAQVEQISSMIDTVEINCLNHRDSLHLYRVQVFDSLSCQYLTEYKLAIDKNDSLVNQVIFQRDESMYFMKLIRIKPNVYDVFYDTDENIEFRERIEISEHSLCYYYPIYNAYDNDSTQRKKEFDSLNYEYHKYFFNYGFVTRFEQAFVDNGILSKSYSEIAEYEYVFFENEIHIVVDRKHKEKWLTLIHFDSSEGMRALSKFNLLQFIYASPFFSDYKVHYPVVLFHFPELLEKLR